MATIEEGSKNYIKSIFEGWEDTGIMEMCADAYISGATAQDKIARQEERERCIKAAIEWTCNDCEEHTKNWCPNECYLCTTPNKIRKAMEGGEG